ncbi:hypothetical protein J5N97_019313 [Dioscorea zingiberensis]|uniref:Aminotransferase-like plant mobile domain-containing protein n=1 Tax=Dioscorea zingiberensis TaxID=325984 RepID=A0A9D5CED1_9LILI|nr:hypothetical protein J5N97_019313 [Dioscorea zingiberensis]
MTHSHAGSLLGLPTVGLDVDGLITKLLHMRTRQDRCAFLLTFPNTIDVELIQMPDGEDFKRRLLLYIVGSIIRPTGNVHVSTSYLSLLHHLDEIKDMNWAKFAFEGVLAAVRTYKIARARGLPNKCIGGCIWLLQLFYLEHLAIGIIHQPIIELETPRVSFWTDARITRAMKHVIHRGGVRAHTVDMFTPSYHTTRVEGQDVNDLKSQLDALQREVIILKSHVTLSLVDVRREMTDMVDRALAGVRADLESQGKEIACIRQMLEDFIARAGNGTKSGVGAPENTQKKEANDVLEDPVKEPQMRVITPSIDSSVNYPLQQSLVASRRDTLRSADQRIPGAKKRSPYVRYPRKEKAKQVKIADATVEGREVAIEASDALMREKIYTMDYLIL